MGAGPPIAAVHIGNEPCTGVSVASTTSLTCAAPSRVASAHAIKITVLGQVSNVDKTVQYYGAATVASVSPLTFLVAGGQTLTVLGTLFPHGNTANGNPPPVPIVEIGGKDVG